MVDKAINYVSYKEKTGDAFNNSCKYIQIINIDKDEKNIKPVLKINKAKIDENQ